MNIPPIRILIDARMLIGRFSGVARVVTRLVDQLAADSRLRVIALCGNEPYAPWNGRKDIEVLGTSFSREDRTPRRRLQWENSQLPRITRQSRADVFHATWNSGVPRGCTIPTLLTIHDLIPWRERGVGWRGRWEAWAYRRGVMSSARRASLVTTVSDFVRGDVIDTLRLRGERVMTVHNGVDRVEPHRASSHPANPFVLYVGGHEPRKNVAGALSAMIEYWKQHGFGLGLRLTGSVEGLDRSASAVLNRLSPEAPIDFIGSPSDEQLAGEYRNATALLMLSQAEGFGLPVLEAMAHGCPVIAAAAASLPEVVGDAGVLVNANSPLDAASAIRRVMIDAEFRSNLIRRGFERANRFSWQAAAERYLRLYLFMAKARTLSVDGALPHLGTAGGIGLPSPA